MDIHKPKAAHSFREFLIEIGTIVIGILIALVHRSAHPKNRSHKARDRGTSHKGDLRRALISFLGGPLIRALLRLISANHPSRPLGESAPWQALRTSCKSLHEYRPCRRLATAPERKRQRYFASAGSSTR